MMSNLGITKPEYTSNQLKKIMLQEKMFKPRHGVCIDEKNLYILQWNASRVYPVKLIKVYVNELILKVKQA
jgi:hypothetical protein